MKGSKLIPDADLTILNNLKQTGPARRRGEEQLFTSYNYFIQRGMQKYSLPEEEAFDAYADAVLSAIDTITKGSFAGLSTLKTYLFGIFRNKCVDLLRKKTTNRSSVHRTVSITDMLFYISDSGKTVIQRLIEQADRDTLKKKLNELGDACRQLLLLSAEGNTDRQIAELTEYKTAAVVKTSRLRCLERLRHLYNSV
jgi:RNA polymerase sigma factor (sigma-70 family)